MPSLVLFGPQLEEKHKGGGGEHFVPPSLYFSKIAHLDRVNHIMVVFICRQKYDYANLNQFPPNFAMACKTIKIFMYQIRSHLDHRKQRDGP